MCVVFGGVYLLKNVGPLFTPRLSLFKECVKKYGCLSCISAEADSRSLGLISCFHSQTLSTLDTLRVGLIPQKCCLSRAIQRCEGTGAHPEPVIPNILSAKTFLSFFLRCKYWSTVYLLSTIISNNSECAVE